MLLRPLALLCLVASAVPREHHEWRCDHTPSAHNITYRVGTRRHEGAKYHHDVGKRALDQPFRMSVYYDSSVETSGLPASTVTRIKNTIDNLREFYQQALRIRSFPGPILLDRSCTGGVFFLPEPGSDDKRCKFTCSPTSTCGDIAIPNEHLKACIQCNGASSNCQTVGSDGAGVANSDFVLYVSATTSGSCPTISSTQGTVAFAGACQMESEYDRPIAGFVNFCPLSLSSGDVDDDFVLAVAKHEILHALAFSSGLYPWWRDGNGDPRTPRNANGYPPQDNLNNYVASSNTLRTVSYNNWQTRTGTVSHEVTMLVTPRIVEVAQGHFNCPTLEGMEVENQGGLGTALSHWEKRLVENEGMTGIVSNEAVFSRFTFALLEDSGWYEVDYSMAGQLVWGNDQGCVFAAGSCGGFIKSQQEQNQPLTPFCNTLQDNSQHGCTITRNAVSFCNLEIFNSAVEEEYQYFQSGANFNGSTTDLTRIGGGTIIADYCPYQRAFINTVCADPANDRGTGTSNIAAESYGTGSRCIEQGNTWTISTGFQSIPSSSVGAGCYQYSCSESRVSITIFGTTYTCAEKGEIINVEVTESGFTHSGTLICPSCVDICYDDFQNCPEATELFSQPDPTESIMTTTESESSGHINLAPTFAALFIVFSIVTSLIIQ